MKRLLPLYRFGWAFLLAWVFSVFYTQVIEGYTPSGVASENLDDAGLMIFFMGLPVVFSVLTLLCVVLLEKRFGSPINNPRMLIIAPVITALSCPLLFVQLDDFSATMLMFAGGAALTGIGSGLMWVMWGEYYAKVSQEDVEYLAPLSTATAAVLLLLVSSMGGWVALVTVTCFPLIAGFCLYLSWHDVQKEVATAEYSGAKEQQEFVDSHARAEKRPWRALLVMGRAGPGILVACLFVCLLGSFWSEGPDDELLFQIIIVVSVCFMSAVSFVSAKGPERISVSFLFRWMCPLLVLGFVAIILWGDSWGGYIASMISTAARFSFCLITQMFFARYATSGRTTAVQAYGFGWIFVHLGDFLGVLCIVILSPFQATGVVLSYQIAAVSIALLTVLTMLILNRPRGLAAGGESVLGAVGIGSLDVRENAKNALLELDNDRALQNVGEEQIAAAQLLKDQSAKRTPEDAFEEHLRVLAKEYKLTPREIEVLALLARGRSVPFIRDHLVISRDTAATHVKHIYTKMGIHSRQELIDLTQSY